MGSGAVTGGTLGRRGFSAHNRLKPGIALITTILEDRHSAILAAPAENPTADRSHLPARRDRSPRTGRGSPSRYHGRMSRAFSLFMSLYLLSALSCGGDAPQEIRGLWVVRHTLKSEESIRRMVDDASQAGFNTLLVQIRGRGDAFYESRLVPRAENLSEQPDDFDPLAVTIAQARRKGLRIHAWFNVCLVGNLSRVPASSQHVALQHPDWLLLPEKLFPSPGKTPARSASQVSRLQAELRKTRGQGLFLDPTHPGVQAHLVEVVQELLSRYPVDGLHLDYIRYPDARVSFTPAAIDAFARTLPESIGEKARSDPLIDTRRHPDLWSAFRQKSVTELTRQIASAARQTRPQILVSAAVIADREEATTLRGQDWFQWLEEGIVDVVCPMAYRPDMAQFREEIEQARGSSFGHQVWAGIGAYKLESEGVIAQIELTRTLRADGFVIFSYTSLAEEASARVRFLKPIGDFLNPAPKSLSE